jgi:hypothetical protein
MTYIVDFFSTKEWWKLLSNNRLVDRGRCLAEPGVQYVVWLNGGGTVTVDLSDASRPLSIEWLNPVSGQMIQAGTTQGGAKRAFVPPFEGDAVLSLTASHGSLLQ